MIKEFSEPGSGFRIAYDEYKNPGGGNLLGISHTGLISAVGYELYTELMEKTVRESRKRNPEEELLPEIQLGVFTCQSMCRMFISDWSYIKEYLCLQMMKILIRSKASYRDSYGILPPSADNLLQVINIRNCLKPLQGKKEWDMTVNICIFSPDLLPLTRQRLLLLTTRKSKAYALHRIINCLYPCQLFHEKGNTDSGRSAIKDTLPNRRKQDIKKCYDKCKIAFIQKIAGNNSYSLRYAITDALFFPAIKLISFLVPM